MEYNTFWFVFLRYTITAAEIAAGAVLLLLKAPKRDRFPLRAGCSAVTLVGFILLLSWLMKICLDFYDSDSSNAVFVFLQCLSYLVLFAGVIGALSVCWKGHFYQHLFTGILSYCFRNFIFNIYLLVVNLFAASWNTFVYQQMNLPHMSVYLLYDLAAYALFCYLYCRDYEVQEDWKNYGWTGIVLFAVVLVVNVSVGCLVEIYSQDHYMLYLCCVIMQIVIMLFTLFFHRTVVSRIRLAEEKKTVDTILRQQEQQFEFTRSNAELLNIRAHDLKHQAAALRRGGEEAEKIIAGLEEVTAEHDSIVMTDNATVNVVLSEKWMYCARNNIRLSYMVDSHSLDFMENTDLYSLLGNILDNSIQAVLKLSDANRRIITFSATDKSGVVTVSCSNNFEGRIEFRKGLPVSTRGTEAEGHGFGMKSIRRIADKYAGSMFISAEDSVFRISIAFAK